MNFHSALCSPVPSNFQQTHRKFKAKELSDFQHSAYFDFRFVFPRIDKFIFSCLLLSVAIRFGKMFPHKVLPMQQWLHLHCHMTFGKNVFVGWQRNQGKHFYFTAKKLILEKTSRYLYVSRISMI